MCFSGGEQIKSEQKSNAIEQAGFDNAIKTLTDSYNLSYDTAKNYLTRAYDEAQRGNTEAINQISTMFPEARSAIQQGYSEATQKLQPYAQAGTSALTAYQDLISGKTDISTDPLYQQQVGLLNKQLAAQGYTGSGTANIAGMTPVMASAYSQRANLLSPLLQQGYSAASGQATLQANQGSSLADLYSNQGTATAGLMQQGAMNQSNILQNTGLNLSDMQSNYGSVLSSTALGKAFALAKSKRNKAAIKAANENMFWQTLASGAKTAASMMSGGGIGAGIGAGSSSIGLSGMDYNPSSNYVG